MYKRQVACAALDGRDAHVVQSIRLEDACPGVAGDLGDLLFQVVIAAKAEQVGKADAVAGNPVHHAAGDLLHRRTGEPQGPLAVLT